MADELNLDDIVGNSELTADNLSEEQKNFLNSNKADLDDETAERFGIDLTPKVPDPVKRGEKPPVSGDDKNKNTPPAPTGDDDDDDLIDPDEKKRIQKEIQKNVAPIKQQFEQHNQILQEQRDIAEVDNFIRVDKTGVAGKYRDSMLTYMKTYPTVPVDGVFAMVAKDELMRIGAKKEREAAQKANGSRTQTSQARPTSSSGNKKDWAKASQDDYKAKLAEVLGRPA